MAARGREDLLFQIGYLFEANHQFHFTKSMEIAETRRRRMKKKKDCLL